MEERIEKHGYGTDTATAAKNDLEEYVKTKMHVHVREDFSDNAVWYAFKEEFEDFAADDFRKLRTDTRIKLRLHLLRGGVFVAQHASARCALSDVLFDVTQEDEQHEWTDEEISSAFEEVKVMITVALRHRLTPDLDALAPPKTTHRLLSPRPMPPPPASTPSLRKDLCCRLDLRHPPALLHDMCLSDL